MFYAAGLRRSQFLRVTARVKSSPLISIASSSGRIVMLPASGYRRPREPAFLEPLGAYPKPTAIPHERFDTRAAAVGEQE